MRMAKGLPLEQREIRQTCVGMGMIYGRYVVHKLGKHAWELSMFLESLALMLNLHKKYPIFAYYDGQ